MNGQARKKPVNSYTNCMIRRPEETMNADMTNRTDRVSM